MKNAVDKYAITLSDQPGQPGIRLFQSEDGDVFYFHLNDSNGLPVLYSDPYTTLEGRKNGVRSVMENLEHEKSLRIRNDKDGYYIGLIARNHKEIARSRPYGKRTEAVTALADLKKVMHPDAINREEEKTPDVKPARKVKNARSGKPAIPPASPGPSTPSLTTQKYSFRLDLYPRKEDRTLNGRIYSTIDESSLHFSGLDMEAILHFLEGHLPPDVLQLQKGKNPENGQKESKERLPAGKLETVEPAVASGLAVQENLQIQLVNEKGLVANQNLPVNAPLNFQISLSRDQLARHPKGVKIPVELKLKSIRENQLISVGSFQLDFSDQSKVQAPFPFYIPYPGVFRLIAFSKSPGKDHYNGSLLVAGN